VRPVKRFLTPIHIQKDMASRIQPAILSPNPPAIQSTPRGSPRDVNAATSLSGFSILTAQLVGLLFLFHTYHLETTHFVDMCAIVFGAFLIHYWLPFRFKEAFWVTVSIAGSFLLLDWTVAAGVLGTGIVIFLILQTPLPLRWRLVMVSLLFAILLYGCVTRPAGIPLSFYAVFGGIFMFRVMIYGYDLAHSKEPISFLSYLSYFFILPNYYFTLFPVIDFQTMRSTYYRRNIHAIAQQGIHWMVRGSVQLMLYRVVLYFDDPFLPDRVNSFPKLVTNMILTFLLYLNVSGKFHLIVGMLHLFGYDLPETNRNYLLSSSFLDFWRRINIYWKDFMVKIIYLPVYFKYRKRSDLRAQVLGTAAVFTFTWAAHSYQSLWIDGKLSITWPDTIFWSALGILVMANVVFNWWCKPRKIAPSWQSRSLHAMRVLGTVGAILILWSLWSSPSISSWLYLMSRWTQGPIQ
jgi:alginate O-acetyltransferase complex protein AlgI